MPDSTANIVMKQFSEIFPVLLQGKLAAEEEAVDEFIDAQGLDWEKLCSQVETLSKQRKGMDEIIPIMTAAMDGNQKAAENLITLYLLRVAAARALMTITALSDADQESQSGIKEVVPLGAARKLHTWRDHLEGILTKFGGVGNYQAKENIRQFEAAVHAIIAQQRGEGI